MVFFQIVVSGLFSTSSVRSFFEDITSSTSTLMLPFFLPPKVSFIRPLKKDTYQFYPALFEPRCLGLLASLSMLFKDSLLLSSRSSVPSLVVFAIRDYELQPSSE